MDKNKEGERGIKNMKVYGRLTFLASLFFLIVSLGDFSRLLFSSDDRCKECRRSAAIASYDSNADPMLEHSIRGLLAETVITHCFRLKVPLDMIPEEYRYRVKPKPPEYLFRISYNENLEGRVKSRLKIDLYYDGKTEEHVKTWMTEATKTTQKFPFHEHGMFKLGKQILRKSRPLEVTVLNDFEKRPYSCEVKAEKEEVIPGELIEVQLTDIHDIEDMKSREFNRIVIQAVEGEILDGEALEVDPDLKAFLVGDGTIRFKYIAPDSCKKSEDTIFIYNSCDILREDLYPLSKTEIKDKIAEKKIQIGCGDWFGSLVYSKSGSEKWSERTDLKESVYEVKKTCFVNIQATIPISLKMSEDPFSAGSYHQSNLGGRYSLSYKEIVVEKTMYKKGGTFTLTTTREANCGGYLPTSPSVDSPKMASLTVDENNKTYALNLSFSYDGGCMGTSTVESSEGDSFRSTWEVERFVFDTWQLRNMYGSSSFQGSTDGKTIMGSWSSPESAKKCNIDGYPGVTVQWKLTKRGRSSK